MIEILGIVTAVLLIIIPWIQKERIKVKEEYLQAQRDEKLRKTMENIRKDFCEEEYLSKDLKAYKTLFDAKKRYLIKMIDSTFTEGTLTYNKYHNAIEDLEEAFKKRIRESNRIWDLTIINKEHEISKIYDDKISEIETILEGIEDLMLTFIKNENIKENDDFWKLIETLDYLKKTSCGYIKED